MGWFHDTFGFSSQPAIEAVSDAAGDVWNHTTQLPGNVAEKITGSDKLQNLLNPPTWQELGKPGEAFYNDVNDAIAYVPTKELRSYAPQIIGTALNFVPGVGWALSAGFNTLYNAGAMQANNKGMDWGSVGKDALKNFAVSGAGKLAGNALQAGKAAQASNAAAKATQTAANSGSLAQNLASGVGNAAGAGTGAGLGAAVPQGFNLATTGSTIPAASALARFKADNAAASPESYSMDTGSSLPSTSTSGSGVGFGDAAYNAGMKAVQPLTDTALTATLAPEGASALSGFDTGAGINEGDVYQPTGSEVLSAFGGDFTGKQITAEDMARIYEGLGLNAGQQLNATRDVMLPAGQVEPDPNTPYSNQVMDIGKSYTQAGIDARNAAAGHNYEVYNNDLYNGLVETNPNANITPEMFQGWLNDTSTAPEAIRNQFMPAPQLVGF